jgi:hypothetical protein
MDQTVHFGDEKDDLQFTGYYLLISFLLVYLFALLQFNSPQLEYFLRHHSAFICFPPNWSSFQQHPENFQVAHQLH